MTRFFSVLTTLMFGCAKIPDGGDGPDATETSSESDETGSETSDVAPCGPMPADYVCVPADSEVNVETLCGATFYCGLTCGGLCEDDSIGGGECEGNHEVFFAGASQICIDLLLAAETCHFGLTCGDLDPGKCDPSHPCHNAWREFREAGCEIAGGPNCDWG
jgi:hypothetical protein